MPTTALTPFAPAADLEVVAAGALLVVEEAGLVEVVDALPVVAVVVPLAAPEPVEVAVPLPEAAGGLKVTPTAWQVAWANCSAAARSEPEQLDSMHDVVLDTKAELLHRQVSSVAEQPPRLALAMHVKAHWGTV